MRQVAEPPPPLPPDVPEQVRGLVGTATAKDPARRLPDGAALRDALDRLLEGGRRAARSAVPPHSGMAGYAVDLEPLDPPTADASRSCLRGREPAPRRRRWWPLAIAGVLLCGLATVLVLVGLAGAAGSPDTVRARSAAGPGRPTTSGGSPAAQDRAAPGTRRRPGPCSRPRFADRGLPGGRWSPTAQRRRPTGTGDTTGTGAAGSAGGHGGARPERRNRQHHRTGDDRRQRTRRGEPRHRRPGRHHRWRRNGQRHRNGRPDRRRLVGRPDRQRVDRGPDRGPPAAAPPAAPRPDRPRAPPAAVPRTAARRAPARQWAVRHGHRGHRDPEHRDLGCGHVRRRGTSTAPAGG